MIARNDGPPGIALVCLPWHLLTSPSIQLGTLQAACEEAGLSVRSYSFHLAFAEFLHAGTGSGEFGLDEYGEVATRWENVGLGDWLFAAPEFGGPTGERDREYEALLSSAGVGAELLERLRRLRARIPRFIAACANELAAEAPTVVGFTNVYSQTWPSAALAIELRKRLPSARFVLGGTNGDGPMGPALLECFPQFDHVFRGRCESDAVRVLGDLSRGLAAPEVPGLCSREGDEVTAVPQRSETGAMDALPVPSYGEYFERLERSPLAGRILPQLPFESARGCWWGEISHCTFCGLNGEDMRFRSKSAPRLAGELRQLAQRHGVLDFLSVDNILDLGYFDEFLPDLAASEFDGSLFFETKANLTLAQVRTLASAGVRAIQPGIESLSTPLLASMRKGATAIHNVRLLKWCAAAGVRVVWNLLHGFPGEDPAEYARMAAMVPALIHLEPPTLSALSVYRFSPYFNDPGAHGLVVTGPMPYYRLLFDAPSETLADLAQNFAFEYVEAQDPVTYVAPLAAAVEDWSAGWKEGRARLSLRRGPDFVVLTDTRFAGQSARYTLTGVEAEVYLALDDGPTLSEVERRLARAGQALGRAELEALLSELVELQLLFADRGRFLSLAVQERLEGTRRTKSEGRAAGQSRWTPVPR